MKIEVGSVINELRIKQNLTREEPDNDICEPNALSVYERSITSPTIDELALFADGRKLTCRISSLAKMKRFIIT
ncbi:hypothetical protein IOC57_23190 [Bacillus sp. SD075]|uniref:hypothetical protein n=1 Tax=Bacillus sp. SD075 TaxID=2781732 RepID=UPI001A971C77|nr:hypothetical protein [Bacillus sp. SD075]MBO1000635.1 hypothetical protein [Bacillus sp. SD075]